MAKRKPKTYEFRAVADMHRVPLEKLGAFCEDLRLWLSVHRIAQAEGLASSTSPDVFGWIDDNRHDVRVTFNVRTEQSTAVDAVDPHTEEQFGGVQPNRGDKDA